MLLKACGHSIFFKRSVHAFYCRQVISLSFYRMILTFFQRISLKWSKFLSNSLNVSLKFYETYFIPKMNRNEDCEIASPYCTFNVRLDTRRSITKYRFWRQFQVYIRFAVRYYYLGIENNKTGSYSRFVDFGLENFPPTMFNTFVV